MLKHHSSIVPTSIHLPRRLVKHQRTHERYFESLHCTSSSRYINFHCARKHCNHTIPPPLQLPLVHASFHQCVWSLHIISSGSAKEAAVGYVNGGDVLRLVHRNKNKACLTVGARDCDLSVKLPVPTKA